MGEVHTYNRGFQSIDNIQLKCPFDYRLHHDFAFIKVSTCWFIYFIIVLKPLATLNFCYT